MESTSNVPGLAARPSNATDTRIPPSQIGRVGIPWCPLCQLGILRPGIVWFGEKLPLDALARIDAWFTSAPKVDLVLLIGTERAPFVREAMDRGAISAYLNIFEGAMDSNDTGDYDWVINGDASHTLSDIIGRALGMGSQASASS